MKTTEIMSDPAPRIPLVARIAFSVWMLFWAPVILWTYGPQNFLWLCNLAQFLMLYALWTGNRLLLASQAGMMVAVGIGWSMDYIVALFLSDSITGFTSYMFNPEIPLLARATSLYHVFLPPFVLWLCLRMGYDRRGWIVQCFIGGVALLASRLMTEPDRNVNWVFAFFDAEPWVAAPVYVALLVVLYPLLLYLPGHFIVRGLLKVLGRRRE